MIKKTIASYAPSNKNFFCLWLFHLLSLFGSEMTRFIIPIWVFEKDQKLVNFSLLICMGIIPRIFLSAISGGIIDCLNQRKLLTNCCLFMSTILGLITAISLDTFHQHFYFLCLLIFLMSCFGNVIHIATLSFVPKLVPVEDLQKCNGLMIAAESSATILSSLIAGFLLVYLNFSSIIFLDMSLMVIALIFIQQINKTSITETSKGSFPILKDVFGSLNNGFNFIRNNRRLVILLTTIAIINFLFSFSFIAFTPLILSETNNNTSLLGIIISIASSGQLVGALFSGFLLKSIPTFSLIFKSIIFLGFLGPVVIGLNSSPIFWVFGYTLTLFFLAIINTTNQALWQKYSPNDLQGSIFGIRRTISSIMTPVGTLLFPFAFDYIFIPFQPHFLKNQYQMMFMLVGIAISLTGLIGYRSFNKLSELNPSVNI